MDGHVITWSKKEDVLESELNMIGEITMNTQKKNCEYSHIKKTRSRVKTRCTWGYSFVSYLWSKNWVSEKSNKALNHQSSQASLNPAHGIKSLRFQFDPQSKSLCNIYTFSLSVFLISPFSAHSFFYGFPRLFLLLRAPLAHSSRARWAKNLQTKLCIIPDNLCQENRNWCQQGQPSVYWQFIAELGLRLKKLNLVW